MVAELTGVRSVHGQLVIAEGPAQPCAWAQNVWFDVHRFEAASIREAVHELCAVQRNWWPYAFQMFRRSELSKQRLPFVTARALAFPEPAPVAQLGSFTWLGQTELLCAAQCASPFPNGEAQFVEFREHEGPPSRAYLKLFEALTVLGRRPKQGDRCLEIGASPGGWTWVLATLGARVVAVDRAPLAPNVAKLPNVEQVQGNAFTATPDQIGPVEWLFSDVVCYPEKLYRYVRLWLDSGACRNFACTLKFQGSDHYGAIEQFRALPGGRVVHLFHNRHELTWLCCAE